MMAKKKIFVVLMGLSDEILIEAAYTDIDRARKRRDVMADRKRWPATARQLSQGNRSAEPGGAECRAGGAIDCLGRGRRRGCEQGAESDHGPVPDRLCGQGSPGGRQGSGAAAGALGSGGDGCFVGALAALADLQLSS